MRLVILPRFAWVVPRIFRSQIMKKTIITQIALLFLLSAMAPVLRAQSPTPAAVPDAQFLTLEGTVQIYPAGGGGWVLAQTNQPLHFGDRLRTFERSRATVRLSDQTVLRLNELTTLTLAAPATAGAQSMLDMKSGSVYFLDRDKPATQEFRTPLTSGAIRGTEFNLAVADDGRTVVTLIDGQVGLSNELGQVDMSSGEQGVVEAGKAPVKSPMLSAINIIQWCLYYPGVLDADDLELSPEEQQTLSDSLSAYRAGDLLQAVASYPPGLTAGSGSLQVYHAATLIAVGQVEQAETILGRLPSSEGQGKRESKLATGLLEMIATVKGQPGPHVTSPKLTTEWLAESYYFQSHARLGEALNAARSAVAVAPNFGFGWARVAELELSFGRLPQALTALDRSLQLSPRNAQSLAVKGFIQLAQGSERRARASFDQAIAVDGALGNAWIGRGLCQIWRGDTAAGRKSFEVAAVLEPQRAEFRSYLGKAFSAQGDNRRALKELSLGQKLDPNDPTAWLYRALVEQKENLINPALRDLEESQKLNDNRQIFRSRLLLDEDQAVRSANLARVYQDIGYINMNLDAPASDWSVNEASRAVNYDYANYSAHQFLADSYNSLRDPNQINVRYETPWFDELIVSELLSPAAAGNLSEFSSQRQYAQLFGQNHLGLSSATEYLSNGSWLQQSSQFGTYDDLSYAIDNEYTAQNGWRNNDDSSDNTTSAKAKVQITPQDSFFMEGIYYSSTFGDTAQYYNQYGTVPGVKPAPSPTFRGNEWQQPDAFLGYHHEWGPGVHTLFLGGYLNDTLQYSDPNAVGLVNSAGFLGTNTFPTTYHRDFTAYSAELQQIFQSPLSTLVIGGRYQKGWNVTSASEVYNQSFFGSTTFAQPDTGTTLERYVGYGYETLNLFDQLQLTGGLTYDYLKYPVNIENAPVSNQENSLDQFSPKAGFIWTITPDTDFRFAYTRSLGGLSYDNSVRLEPTEVSGFNQTFRSIIPESVVGVVPGSRFTTYDLALDQSFRTNTFFTVEGQILDSDGFQSVGIFNATPFGFPLGVANTPENLNYTEETLAASLDQLLGDQWSVGARYQLSWAQLNSQFTGFLPAQIQSARMQQLELHANYYLPCGFFSQVQSVWTAQSNLGYTPELADAGFWQFNAYFGYRFWHRAAELRIGILNIADQNYLLNPLNLYDDLPRSRTLSVSFKFFF
jgi:Flp pilus assembly protein TadD